MYKSSQIFIIFHFLFLFADNCIDDQTSFELLTEEALREIVPKVGLRLKFLAKFKQHMSMVL